MSCSLTSGIALSDCNTTVGGIKKVWVANYLDLVNSSNSTIASGAITASTDTLNFYEIEQHPEMAELNVRIQSSPENGTTFYDQELSIVVRDLDSTTQVVVEDITKASTTILVELNDGNYLLLGAENGCDGSGGQLVTGRGFGDMQSITLNIRGRETDNMVVHATSTAVAGFSNWSLNAN